MKKKFFIVYASTDGKEYVGGIFYGTEEEVKSYCEGLTFEEECEAYGCCGDDDYEEPYPYVTRYSYKETTVLNGDELSGIL